MTEATFLQSKLLEEVKKKITPNEALVDVLADLFEVSKDSAYRRIRLTKLLSLEEVVELCMIYDLSLDEYLNQSTRRITFTHQPITEQGFTFIDYLEYVERMTSKIRAAEDKEMLYLANDIPMFHLMNVPEMAAFKLFFWQKTILNFESLRKEKFKPGPRDERVNSASRKMREHYLRIPSIEIYTPETIDITLKQIDYYYETGVFEKDQFAFILCEKLLLLIEHLKAQCERGYKFNMETSDKNEFRGMGDYKVYYNEVLYVDTTILARLDEERWSYTNNNGMNIMSTKDPNYFKEQRDAFEVLQSKSTLISGDSEKERNKVFKAYERKVRRMMSKFE